MKPYATLLLLALTALNAGCGKRSSGLDGPVTPIMPEWARVALGKSMRFAAPTLGDSIQWSISSPAGSGEIAPSGNYYAPLRMPSSTTVTITAHGSRNDGEATVLLMPGSPSWRDCFGATQEVPPEHDESFYVFVDGLPRALVIVPPVYPDSARDAGIEGTVLVMALVCACGEVLETRMASSIPALDAAAATAVQQWVFSPASNQGEPVAVWVAVPVRFRLH